MEITPLLEETVRVIAACGVAIELNTSGWRKPVAECYPRAELLALADAHANFTYTASVLDEDGPMDKTVLAIHPALAGWRAYVCGDPAIVQRFRKTLFLAGASLNERQNLVLNLLLDGMQGKLTTSKYATLAKCSQDTALRDIAQLVERCLLYTSDAADE